MYRTRLANDPTDSNARVKLAWCLFMHALFRAGQESMLKALFATLEPDTVEKGRKVQSIWDQDADNLIDDCLQQTATVMQLSSDPRDLTDADRLQNLVELSGAGKAVDEAKDNSNRILAELLQDLI